MLNSVVEPLENGMNLICPDCLNPVETIKACGCRDYFCNHCNQLVSKRRVVEAEANSTLNEKRSAEVDQLSMSGTGH
jgi:hypothetical protein